MRATAVGRGAGLAGAALGVLAAGAAAGLVAERYAVGRLRLRPDPEAREPFGRLPADRVSTVLADDGVALHVEEAGDLDAPLTVVLVHGWTVTMTSWHYQQRDLGGHEQPLGRLVLYDQRSHGRSGPGARERSTIDQLGADLYAVLQAVAPRGPVLLVGQSMGGMTIMALADRHPELFGERVIGVALLSTAAGKLAEVTLGLPVTLPATLRRAAPRAFDRLRRHADLVERGRAAGSDLAWLLTRWYAFGSSDVSPALVELMERMVAATPIDVVIDYYDGLMAHDKLAALPALAGVETLVLCGENDKLTPAAYSRAIAEALPGAELVLLPGAGHMVMLERPQLVNFHLRALAARALARFADRSAAGR
ncbi:MAG: alpha/beta fold hydrolase [Frankiaceae bacterium]